MEPLDVGPKQVPKTSTKSSSYQILGPDRQFFSSKSYSIWPFILTQTISLSHDWLCKKTAFSKLVERDRKIQALHLRICSSRQQADLGATPTTAKPSVQEKQGRAFKRPWSSHWNWALQTVTSIQNTSLKLKKMYRKSNPDLVQSQGDEKSYCLLSNTDSLTTEGKKNKNSNDYEVNNNFIGSNIQEVD